MEKIAPQKTPSSSIGFNAATGTDAPTRALVLARVALILLRFLRWR